MKTEEDKIKIKEITTVYETTNKRIELNYNGGVITAYMDITRGEYEQLDVRYRIDEEDAKTLNEKEQEEIMSFLENMEDIADY